MTELLNSHAGAALGQVEEQADGAVAETRKVIKHCGEILQTNPFPLNLLLLFLDPLLDPLLFQGPKAGVKKLRDATQNHAL